MSDTIPVNVDLLAEFRRVRELYELRRALIPTDKPWSPYPHGADELRRQRRREVFTDESCFVKRQLEAIRPDAFPPYQNQIMQRPIPSEPQARVERRMVVDHVSINPRGEFELGWREK